MKYVIQALFDLMCKTPDFIQAMLGMLMAAMFWFGAYLIIFKLVSIRLKKYNYHPLLTVRWVKGKGFRFFVYRRKKKCYMKLDPVIGIQKRTESRTVPAISMKRSTLRPWKSTIRPIWKRSRK